MAVCNNNTKASRLDEKRKFLLPLILISAGVVFVGLGFFRQLGTTGKSFNEYQFNRAVVANEVLESETSTTGKNGKTTKPSKTEKKEPAYCPT